LAQIQTLSRIEKDLRGQTADQRRTARQGRSKPIIEDFKLWLTQSRARVSAKSPTGEALKYIDKYWDRLCRFLGDGRVELDNNSVERTNRLPAGFSPAPPLVRSPVFAGGFEVALLSGPSRSRCPDGSGKVPGSSPHLAREGGKPWHSPFVIVLYEPDRAEPRINPSSDCAASAGRKCTVIRPSENRPPAPNGTGRKPVHA
jgi:hypothetical protein